MCALTKEEVIAQLQKEVRILRAPREQDRSRPARLPADAEAAQHDRAAAISGQYGTAAREGDQVGHVRRRGVAGRDGEGQRRGLRAAVVNDPRAGSEYATLLSSWTEADFRGSIEMFGRSATRASWLLELVLNGCAAYRTQLFCYLKACGREELTTANLWQGVDAAVPA
jgi:hypothetical protein